MVNPEEGEYRSKVKTFVNDIFIAILNEVLAKEILENGKKTTVVGLELIYNAEWLLEEFICEVNFVASRC